MKAVLLKDEFHYTTKDTDFTPKGTLMLHYALEGSKEELDAYEEAKGENFSVVKAGTHKDKPLWFTSRTKLGDSVDVKMDKNGNLNPVETIETAIEKSEEKKQQRALEQKAEQNMRKKALLAKELGLTVSL